MKKTAHMELNIALEDFENFIIRLGLRQLDFVINLVKHGKKSYPFMIAFLVYIVFISC